MIRVLTCTALLLVLGLGCGESKVGNGPSEDIATPPVDTAINPVDTHVSVGDTTPSDTASPPEDTADDAALNCDGNTKDSGCPCASNDDCASSYCHITNQGKSCAELCESKCPDGYDCSPVQTAGGGDPVYICVQRALYLCMPCEKNADCTVPGFEGKDKCVSYGSAGSFCGMACQGTEGCLSGYSCTDGQCLADGGECSCQPLYVDLESKTACAVSNDWGACEGTRQCGEAGLTGCDALIPAKDGCDAIDNDCDGQLDEDCTFQLRGSMMGGGFVLSSEPGGALKIRGSLGTPRFVGQSSGGGFVLRAGFPKSK
jgi:hypothetical protein